VPLIKGEEQTCFGVTEADAGLDTTSIKTFARRTDGGYLVSGGKIWTSTAQIASKIVLLARTTAKPDCRRPTDGITLFLHRSRPSAHRSTRDRKLGRKAVDSNQIFITDLFVPEEDRVGDEGKGFQYLLDSINPERILVAAENVGLGQGALERAARYARERVVFGRPIGKNQGIQHPARAEAGPSSRRHIGWCLRAAWLYDSGKPCAAEANAAKLLAGGAGFEAATRAVLTHGGMGICQGIPCRAAVPRVHPAPDRARGPSNSS